MGSACCVASRDRTVVPNRSVGETLNRNDTPYSPAWSFRWDNRGRVAGEEVSLSGLSDGIGQNNGSEMKYGNSAFVSEGFPLGSSRTRTGQKSPASDRSISRNTSMDVILEQRAREPTEFAAPSYSCPTKFSLPLAPQPSKQVSDSRIFQKNSPNNSSGINDRSGIPWTNESICRSTDDWSMPALSESMAFSGRESWPFDNKSFGFHHEKISKHSKIQASDVQQTCGACSRLLSKKSLWTTQKIIATNELPIVAVLTCGHVYHPECLDHVTPGNDKYDPSCPICTLGEKETLKLSEKALKAEIDWKARSNKRLRNRVMGSDGDLVMFNHSGGHEGHGPRLASSSSMKTLAPKTFLMRHLSFRTSGSHGSPQENCNIKKKGFFWAKSCKI